jgi:hypothetical protein
MSAITSKAFVIHGCQLAHFLWLHPFERRTGLFLEQLSHESVVAVALGHRLDQLVVDMRLAVPFHDEIGQHNKDGHKQRHINVRGPIAIIE